MSIAFSDALNGYAAFYDSSVVRTTDGGATWTPVKIPGTGGGYVYACGNDVFAPKGSNIYRSTDGGVNWSVSFTGSSGDFYACSFISSGSTLTGWAVSTTGKIAQFGGTATPTAIQDGNASRPSAFTLSQNYPNPFNPSTLISYQLAKSAHVTLKIFNALGQEVQTLVDEEKVAGDHQVEWNASGPSGVYFYVLRAGDVSTTKKMILLR